MIPEQLEQALSDYKNQNEMLRSTMIGNYKKIITEYERLSRCIQRRIRGLSSIRARTGKEAKRWQPSRLPESTIMLTSTKWQKEETVEGLDFGYYVLIEQKRYGVENEMYVHKVIGTLQSNAYVDIPVRSTKETIHTKIVDVVACVCCGVCEREILRYRVEDVKKTSVCNRNKRRA
jgi:hypothetical protein